MWPTLSLGRLVKWKTLPKWSRGLLHESFPRKSLWLSTTQNLELRNILSVRPPPYEKNKLTLNEYLDDFMHFESIFFVEKTTNFFFLEPFP